MHARTRAWLAFIVKIFIGAEHGTYRVSEIGDNNDGQDDGDDIRRICFLPPTKKDMDDWTNARTYR